MNHDATDSSQSLTQRLLIRASAGTGKTFQLSSRYISILRHSSPEKILASTFTRKAAGEILERVLLRLALAATDAKSLRVLADSIGPPSLTREECLHLLARFTRQLHRVRISTLDSFFAQLAGSYALELGLPPGWRVLDPLEIEQIRHSAIEEMLSAGAPQDLVQLMHLLDKGQSSRSISRLITETIDNLYYVFLAAPGESWERFPQHPFLPAERREAIRILLEEYPLDKKSLQGARDNDVAAIVAEEWDSLLSRGLMNKVVSGEMKYSRVAIPEAFREPYEELYGHVLAHVSTPWKEQTLAARQLLRDYHAAFERQKQSAGGMEFGDVTRRLAAAQSRNRLVDSSFRLDASIEHLLLDEFQDTSPSQWNVVRSFAEEACRRPGRSFFCVGDTKQAIYGWRGGEAALFDVIAEELPGAASETVELNLSYRSAPAIMHAVNLMMRQMVQHDNLEEHNDVLHQWAKKFPEHQTARKELSGYVCLRTLSDREEEFDPLLEEQETAPEFWTEVAHYVRARRAEAPGASIGILTRKNASVGRMIFELNQLGIDASEEGGNPLTDAAVVQLILSLMTLADHPGHTIAAYHVARSPLAEIFQWSEYASSAARVKFSSRLRQLVIDRGYGGLIHDLVPKLAPYCNRREYQRLVQLSELADRYDGLFAGLRPAEFATFIEQQRKEEPSSASVRVMTVHQSKGLEFDIVILPDLDAGLYLSPKYVSHTPSPGAPPDLVALYRSEPFFKSLGGELAQARQFTRDRLFQEALCLLYVAVTRPVRSLHLLVNPKIRKSTPKTFAGLIRAAVAPQVPLEPNKILWEYGQSDWFKSLPPSHGMNGKEADSFGTAGPRIIEMAVSQRRKHWNRQSPSEQKFVATYKLNKDLQPANTTGMDRGTVLHRWMQEIIWVDGPRPRDLELRNLAHGLGIDEVMATRWLNEFTAIIAAPWCQSLLSRSSYSGNDSVLDLNQRNELLQNQISASVKNELPFSVRLHGQDVLSGFVDRLVIFDKDGSPVAAEIIDFKSDDLSGSPTALLEKVEWYRGQMEAYRTAVASLLRLTPSKVSVKLAFLQTGDVVRVEAN